MKPARRYHTWLNLFLVLVLVGLLALQNGSVDRSSAFWVAYLAEMAPSEAVRNASVVVNESQLTTTTTKMTWWNSSITRVLLRLGPSEPRKRPSRAQLLRELAEAEDERLVRRVAQALGLDLCSPVPRVVLGALSISAAPRDFHAFSFVRPSSVAFVEGVGMQLGGAWRPTKCVARHSVAVVVPYKNRLENLNTFLFHMHPFLQRQELSYQVFVVEQVNEQPFNKGVLMNAAFQEIFVRRRGQFNCVIMHDVDLLPTDDLNMYSCPFDRPRHLSILVDEHDYRVKYPILVGGVLNFPVRHFAQVNGYSNAYWGWGAEDDDMYYRLKATGIGFERPFRNTHYKMLTHSSRYQNPNRMKLLTEAVGRLSKDGLNSVRYTLNGVVKYPMFTHILVDTGFMPTEATPPPLSPLPPVSSSS